jgi:hypothetical protein
VCVEIVSELPFGDQHGIDELLDLRVVGLSQKVPR